MSEQTATREALGGELVGIACILSLGAFAALLDTTVVGVAVRTLSIAFSTNLADIQWATTAYLLALAAVIPGTGWAAARFGATAAWTGSLCVFLAGSVLCGLSWSLSSLIAFRVLQGAGAIVVPAGHREFQFRHGSRPLCCWRARGAVVELNRTGRSAPEPAESSAPPSCA